MSLRWTIHINQIENQTSLDSIMIIKGASMRILLNEYQGPFFRLWLVLSQYWIIKHTFVLISGHNYTSFLVDVWLREVIE